MERSESEDGSHVGRLGVRPCMQSVRFDFEILKSIASTTTNTKRRRQMTTTDYGDNAARRATLNGGHVDRQKTSSGCTPNKGLVSVPKCRLSGPYQGELSLEEPASSRCTAASPAPAGSSRGRKPDDVYRARANPSASLHPLPTT